ncbi:50S ribosomal protein L23 [Desulfovibrio sp. PG-178-WT-4]|uniref:Large ribosomal subunit protein uL23 n=1 Tax=Desulfovibrio porci TaxID=2605782 RepID=A0A6L5XJ97_9BACT|nr:50S ribosomal protein L23 [Desulfovibrio porci]MDY3809096.1 50S ribosomal protein L23 [Desulfovibrio porci]MSS27217.1 50S ribosomal protein L23 [Desulfovibrio porci]
MESTYVLLKPLLTEKTTLLKDEAQQVAFYVHPKANKIEIKQAVEKAFDVKVEAVNVVRRAPSVRERQGRVVGRKPGWKKAYVTLRQGDKIEFFEGV